MSLIQALISITKPTKLQVEYRVNDDLELNLIQYIQEETQLIYIVDLVVDFVEPLKK